MFHTTCPSWSSEKPEPSIHTVIAAVAAAAAAASDTSDASHPARPFARESNCPSTGRRHAVCLPINGKHRPEVVEIIMIRWHAHRLAWCRPLVLSRIECFRSMSY